jgi:signal transduction histidine kinase
MFAFAHDVRSHLRTVVTRIQLVQRGGGKALSEEEQQFLQEGERAAADINGLLSSLLTLMNPEGGDADIPLRLAIQGSLMEMKPILTAAGAKVEVEEGADMKVPASLKRVLKELVTNSCAYRDEQRPVVVLIKSGMTPDGMLTLSVSDNGSGIPPDCVEQIFVPFRRLHSRDKFPGHGLGLSICQRIAEEAGGTITATTKPEGLIVTLTLPVGT